MLTDAKARKAAPAVRDYKLGDAHGLFLLVRPGGSKLWRLKYRIAGREKLLALGRYPEVSLADARAARDESRTALRNGIDPATERKRAAARLAAHISTTLESVARSWHSLNAPRWAARHAADVLANLERDIFPQIGPVPIADLDAPMILKALRTIEARGAIETARRNRQRLEAVFAYALGIGLVTTNPPAMLEMSMQPLPRRGRQPAITALDKAQAMLARIEQEAAFPITLLASRLLALTATRPGTLIGARWDEFSGWEEDDGDALWIIPAARLKMKEARKGDDRNDMMIPLAPQAVAVLRAARPLAPGDLVFPGQRHAHKPLSANAIGYLYNRAGFNGRHVPHGWRATFSTVMNERAMAANNPGDRAVIDLMLGHVPANKVEGAYNRAAYWPRRQDLAREWADLITQGLRPAGELLGGPRR
jgi:integrase